MRDLAIRNTHLSAVTIEDDNYVTDKDGNPVLLNEDLIKKELKRLKSLEPQKKLNAESLSYLFETDWYITRMSETGVQVPSDILNNREEARLSIKNI